MNRRRRLSLHEVETSPDGRYIRFDEKLGSGAYKDVYLCYDSETGQEVAWNTVYLGGLPHDEQERIRGETAILRSLSHPSIIGFGSTWESPQKEEICFTTEIVTSGTLKQYINRVKGIKLKVVKNWCRQILQALHYLHHLSPPIIHRDLKCDNIFMNGSTGEVRLGDFGLARARHSTHVESVLGTPEFIAPELYEQQYTELVDIYAFGMCVLEMVTKEYPFQECFSEDMQVLSEVGFIGLDEVMKRTVNGRDLTRLRFACYNPVTEQMEYQTASALIVKPHGAHRMIEFSSRKEEEEEGKERADSDNVSLLVTADHDMYVRRSQLDECMEAGAEPFAKQTACSLLSEADDFTAYNFLTLPKQGVVPRLPRISFATQLGLHTSNAVSAFLSLYGFWLGQGSMEYQNDRPAAIIFQHKTDQVWLYSMMTTCGLVKGFDFVLQYHHSITQRLRIINEYWVAFFDQQCREDCEQSISCEPPTAVCSSDDEMLISEEELRVLKDEAERAIKHQEEEIELLQTILDSLRSADKSDQPPSVQQIDQQLESSQLRCVEVEADGNSLFRALSLALTGDENEHLTLRRIAMEEIEHDPAFYSRFLVWETVAEYVKRVSRAGERGDHIDLIAYGRSTDISIILHLLNSSPQYIYSGTNPHRTVQLFYISSNHYVAVIPLSSDGLNDAGRSTPVLPRAPVQYMTRKSLAEWVLHGLDREESLKVLEGYSRAVGRKERAMKGEKQGDSRGLKAVYTSSLRMRDQLMTAYLHAGFSPLYKLDYPKGSCLGCQKKQEIERWQQMTVAQQKKQPHLVPKLFPPHFAASLYSDEREHYKFLIAAADHWEVTYSDQQAVLMPHRGEVKAVNDYIGRVWCITVPTGLVMAQRRWKDAKGVVTRVSRPVVIGQCQNAAQIWRKVSAGIKPAVLQRIEWKEVRDFIEICIAPVELRPTAGELLNHPFLLFSSSNPERDDRVCPVREKGEEVAPVSHKQAGGVHALPSVSSSPPPVLRTKSPPEPAQLARQVSHEREGSRSPLYPPSSSPPPHPPAPFSSLSLNTASSPTYASRPTSPTHSSPSGLRTSGTSRPPSISTQPHHPSPSSSTRSTSVASPPPSTHSVTPSFPTPVSVPSQSSLSPIPPSVPSSTSPHPPLPTSVHSISVDIESVVGPLAHVVLHIGLDHRRKKQISFDFDFRADTSMFVASEMVKMLRLPDAAKTEVLIAVELEGKLDGFRRRYFETHRQQTGMGVGGGSKGGATYPPPGHQPPRLTVQPSSPQLTVPAQPQLHAAHSQPLAGTSHRPLQSSQRPPSGSPHPPLQHAVSFSSLPSSPVHAGGHAPSFPAQTPLPRRSTMPPQVNIPAVNSTAAPAKDAKPKSPAPAPPQGGLSPPQSHSQLHLHPNPHPPPHVHAPHSHPPAPVGNPIHSSSSQPSLRVDATHPIAPPSSFTPPAASSSSSPTFQSSTAFTPGAPLPLHTRPNTEHNLTPSSSPTAPVSGRRGSATPLPAPPSFSQTQPLDSSLDPTFDDPHSPFRKHSDLPSTVDQLYKQYSALSVTQLKERIRAKGAQGRLADCLEKKDLIDCLIQLTPVSALPSSPKSGAGSTPSSRHNSRPNSPDVLTKDLHLIATGSRHEMKDPFADLFPSAKSNGNGSAKVEESPSPQSATSPKAFTYQHPSDQVSPTRPALTVPRPASIPMSVRSPYARQTSHPLIPSSPGSTSPAKASPSVLPDPFAHIDSPQLTSSETPSDWTAYFADQAEHEKEKEMGQEIAEKKRAHAAAVSGGNGAMPALGDGTHHAYQTLNHMQRPLNGDTVFKNNTL